jgi:D-tyrosyl-tRNA(Tyr) deacylase
VYLGVGQKDTETDLRYMADKVLHLRIFPDEKGKMNLSVADLAQEVLVVSQFTLYGDARYGRRPSYSSAALPARANELYEGFIAVLRERGLRVQSGCFAAMMEVSYTNAGPVTILLDSEKLF